MLKLFKHSKNPELMLKLPESQLEPLLMLTPKSTTTSTKLPIPHLSKLREMPKPLEPSTLKENQKLLLLSELEGKFKTNVIRF